MQVTNGYPAHLYTWPECWQILQNKGYIIDLRGYAIGVNKTTEAEAYSAWHKAVSFAIQGDRDVPTHVRDNHAAQSKPSKINLLEKPMPPKFTWSYSALTQFENCPLSLAHSRYYKDVPYVESVEQKDGNRKHKALELYVKGVQQPVSEIEVVKPYLKYADAFKNAGGIIQAEREIALTDKLKETTWFASDAWFRIKLDIVLLRGNKCNIYDWKTGKQKDDMTQLKLSCAVLAIIQPELEEFTAKNIWLKTDKIDDGVKLTRADIKPILLDILARVERMRAAWDAEVFQAKPSGLCPWCGYVDKCKYRR